MFREIKAMNHDTMTAMANHAAIISAHMTVLGSKGGTARAQKLSKARRQEIAVKASKAAAKKRAEK
jgi:hypothetical protein